MVEVGEQLDLAQRSLRVLEVREGVGDLLNRDLTARDVVARRANAKTRT